MPSVTASRAPGAADRSRSRRRARPGCAFPARINITVTETRLRQLAAEPRSGAPPGEWDLAPRAAGAWALTLPGGRELAVRFDVVPTHDCDHRHQVGSYEAEPAAAPPDRGP